MTPRYCIAIAHKARSYKAVAITEKMSELLEIVEASKEETIDLYSKGRYLKTVHPANLRAQAKALAEKEKRLARLESRAPAPAREPDPEPEPEDEPEADSIDTPIDDAEDPLG